METFKLPPLTHQDLNLLKDGVKLRRTAVYQDSDQSMVEEMINLLASWAHATSKRGDVKTTLPELTKDQLDLLIRGVGSLGHVDGWSDEERAMDKILKGLSPEYSG